MVFESAFPDLVKALVDAGDADLAQVRQAALVLLYRLLFVLYAEDRGLLPVNDSRYDDYGLRRRVRDDIARRTAQGDAFSAHATSYYDHVTTLGKLIDAGDASIGLPPYNGGLFAPTAAPLLEASRLPDAAFAPIVHGLSHTETAGARGFVNYRDMSVQQLGSIYERLLEREPVRNSSGRDRHSPQPLRAQGQRQLLHAAGAGGPDRGPDPQAADGRAAPGVRGQGAGACERPPAQATSGATSCGGWTRPRRCSNSRCWTRPWAAATSW